jgi:hypothetical protein
MLYFNKTFKGHTSFAYLKLKTEIHHIILIRHCLLFVYISLEQDKWEQGIL